MTLPEEIQKYAIGPTSVFETILWKYQFGKSWEPFSTGNRKILRSELVIVRIFSRNNRCNFVATRKQNTGKINKREHQKIL